MDMEDTVAITANYASPFNIGKIWTTLIDLRIQADSLQGSHDRCTESESDNSLD